MPQALSASLWPRTSAAQTPSMVSMLSEQRAPLSTQLLLAFAALVCVEGFAPAAAPSLLSRSKVAARPQVRHRTIPYTALSDACGSTPRRTAPPGLVGMKWGWQRSFPCLWHSLMSISTNVNHGRP